MVTELILTGVNWRLNFLHSRAYTNIAFKKEKQTLQKLLMQFVASAVYLLEVIQRMYFL